MVDKASGKISKLGRSFARSRDYDAMGADVCNVTFDTDMLFTNAEIDEVCSMSRWRDPEEEGSCPYGVFA